MLLNCGAGEDSWESLEKQGNQIVTGGKGAGHNFWNNNIAQGHSINWLELNGSKMADKSTLTRPQSLINTLNDTHKIAMTVQRHCQKTKEWIVALLEIFTLLTEKRCTTWELWVKFYLGQMKTAAQEAASQRALRDCSKAAVGESQYIRFGQRGSSIPWSTHFTKGFLLVMRVWCHHEGI